MKSQKNRLHIDQYFLTRKAPIRPKILDQISRYILSVSVRNVVRHNTFMKIKGEYYDR